MAIPKIETKPQENITAETLSTYSSMLLEAKNIIFHGVPGTGKTHLAKEIAADIIGNEFFTRKKEYEQELKAVY